MAETFAAEIIISARDFATPALTEVQRSLDRTSMVARGAQTETLAMGRGMNEAESLVRNASLGTERSAGVTDAAFGRMGAGSDRWAADYRAAALDLGLSNDMIGDDMSRMARETGRATDRARDEMGRFAAGTRRAGDQTGESTGLMQRAWRGLDIIDDIGGVIGMVSSLTAGMREMATEAIESSRDVELSLSRIASLQTQYAGGAGGELAIAERGRVAEAAYRFAAGQTDLGEMIPLRETEYIQRTKEARSAGLGIEAAMALTERSALLGVGAEGTTTEAAELLRPLYNIMGDKAAAPMEEIARLTDQVAAAQAQFDIPALGALTEAVSTAATLSRERGLPTEVMLSSIGAFFQGGKSGSEAGEALNSALEEIVGGMEELGTSVVRTAEGYLDLPATLDVLRGLDLGDPTARATTMQDAFGELGSVALALLSGSQYESLTGGIDAIRDSEGIALARAEPVAATRAMRAERIAVMGETDRRAFGDSIEPLDDMMLDIQEAGLRTRLRNREEGRVGGQLGELFRMQEERIRAEGGRSLLGSFALLFDPAGRAIPETMATGVDAGGASLGAAMDTMLGREVTPRLPESDAQIGPLSVLTAAGRAIPMTMAAGVLQSQDILGGALSGALTLPELPEPLAQELLAQFGTVDPAVLPEPLAQELLAQFGTVDPAVLPEPLAQELLAQFGTVDPAVLPEPLAQELLAQFGTVDPAVLPEPLAQELLAQFGTVDPAVLPEPLAQELLAQFGTVDPAVLPEPLAQELLAEYGTVDPAVLPEPIAQELLAEYGTVDPAVLPEPLAQELLAQFGTVDPAVLPEPLAQELLAQYGTVDPAVLPPPLAQELLAEYGTVDPAVLPEPLAQELLAQYGTVDPAVLPEPLAQELLAQYGTVDPAVLPEPLAQELLAQFGTVDPAVLPEPLAQELLAQFGTVDPAVLPEPLAQELLAQFGTVDPAVLPEPLAQELLAQFGTVDPAVLPEPLAQELLAQFGTVDPAVLPEPLAQELLAQFGTVDPAVLPEPLAQELLAQFGTVDPAVLPEPLAQELLAEFGTVDPAVLPATPGQSAPATAVLQALLGGAAGPGDPDLLRVLRDLVEELRASRAAPGPGRGSPLTGAGGAVSIERLDLHVRDDLLHTLSDLHYLLQGRRR